MPRPDNVGQSDVGRKIDFLMKVTNTRNAQLARALSFDASYISRVRAGKRGLPPDQPFIKPASAFFARNAHEGYQREALARELGVMGGWPDDKAKAARLIAAWLKGSGATHVPREHDVSASDAAPTAQLGVPCEARLFFGNDGRREAALAFLGGLAEAGEPCELCLQSDEDVAWMFDDSSFSAEWGRLMRSLAEAGSTFTVVHTVSRDAGEMWEGVSGWLPLYLIGAMRPYYYPRLRDGVRSRSLFVARGRCALASSSVRGMREGEMSVLLHDAGAVRALEGEFDAYLELCRPLMEVERLESRADIPGFVDGFGAGGDGALAAGVGGALVWACVGKGAFLVSPGASPVAYRIEEPHLVDAIASYIGSLPGNVSSPSEIDALLDTPL